MDRLEKCELLKSKGYTYDPETGKIYGIHKKEITTKDKYGYIHITIKGGKLFGHHFAWYMTYGNVDFNLLDHINRVKNDNRISNLRIINHQQNCFNKDSRGYYWDKGRNKWKSQIKLNGKEIHLGRFNTEEEAKASYLEAKKKYQV
jgi:hypothetical protein